MISTNLGTTFKVSPVKPSEELLPTTSYSAALEGLLNHSLEACAKSDSFLVASTSSNSFLTAVHLAFDRHYPLILSPDAVWLCLAQGFALHANTRSAKFHHFLRPKDEETITICSNNFIKGFSKNPWHEVFEVLSAIVKNHIGDKHDLIVSDFSTTGSVERVASEMVLMEPVKQHVNYSMKTLCGIPTITLEGTVDDWRSIRQRALRFADFGLEWWMNALIPILDQFVAAASGSGHLNQKFWQSIYKRNSCLGNSYLTGWIHGLFPYIQDWGTQTYTRRNPYVNSWFKAMDLEGDFGGGLSTDFFPVGLSKVPFKWKYLNLTSDMEFMSGFVGVAQDKRTLAVRPEIGWAVLKADR